MITIEFALIKTVTRSANMVISRLVQVERTVNQKTSLDPKTAKTNMPAITAYFSVPRNVVMS